MVYTLPNKEQLPIITEVLKMVREIVGQMPVRHRMPYDKPIDGDVYLLNRTASGLFTLKPNITKQPCLFFGDNNYHVIQQSAWSRFSKREDFIVQNVLREEFELVMQSHPLCRLLEQGIQTRRQLVRIINPYGNAMAYGFPTAMVPMTSSLETAAFFATHERDEQTGKWTAIPEHDEKGNVNVGVVYMLDLALPFPMMVGLSCIGMQAFERPGRQRLYGFNVEADKNLNDHPFITGFQFKQKPDAVKDLEERFEQGGWLTPTELIAEKASEILKTRKVSEVAFELNCRNNPRDNHFANRKMLGKAGVLIVKDAKHLFTEDELATEYYPTAEERWEEMFSQVVAVHPGFDRLLDDIREFPNTDAGRQYFRK